MSIIEAIKQQLVARNGEVLRYILTLKHPAFSAESQERMELDRMTYEGGHSDDWSSGDEIFEDHQYVINNPVGFYHHGFPHYGFERV